MQLCTRCGISITPDIAKREPKMYSGVSSWCRPCHVAATRAWRATHKADIAHKKQQKYRAHREAEIARRMANFRLHHPLVPKDCLACGSEFTPDRRNSQRYCTVACRQRTRWMQRPERLGKHSRRGILNRDGWRCYLCGKDIPRDKAWPHPLSGSVDHVVPWSVSKNDHPDNLRAAHWHCNYDKGDALPGTEVWVPAEVA
jgi:5-methylcytosine-specific restriction endonuclease McrA